jgi:parvulin-like peptidyl-prolyl isomerase
MSSLRLTAVLIAVAISLVNGFIVTPNRALSVLPYQRQITHSRTEIKMNFFEDAVLFFSNMKKEASAKHILIKGPDSNSKLLILKEELVGAEDLSAAFSELAAKVGIS